MINLARLVQRTAEAVAGVLIVIEDVLIAIVRWLWKRKEPNR